MSKTNDGGRMNNFCRPLMYRRNSYSVDAGHWPYLIEVLGSPNRCDWGQLVAQVWQHCDDPERAAERLVRAANCHDGLVTALRVLRERVIVEVGHGCGAMQAALDVAESELAQSALPTIPSGGPDESGRTVAVLRRAMREQEPTKDVPVPQPAGIVVPAELLRRCLAAAHVAAAAYRDHACFALAREHEALEADLERALLTE